MEVKTPRGADKCPHRAGCGPRALVWGCLRWSVQEKKRAGSYTGNRTIKCKWCGGPSKNSCLCHNTSIPFLKYLFLVNYLSIHMLILLPGPLFSFWGLGKGSDSILVLGVGRWLDKSSHFSWMFAIVLRNSDWSSNSQCVARICSAAVFVLRAALAWSHLVFEEISQVMSWEVKSAGLHPDLPVY